MIKDSINTFNEGLNYDLNPITTPNNVLTDCVNGTFITFNGDELALQTDSGNTTIDYEVQAPVRNAKYGALYNQWALIDIDEPIFTPIGYGLLYNWYAAIDTRNICADGWHIPTKTELETLQTYLGGEAIAGGKLKETGTTYWSTPNTGATNEVGFNARGAGSRGAGYSYYSHYLGIWTSTSVITPPNYAYEGRIEYDVESFRVNSFSTSLKYYGKSLRPLKDSTILTHGQTGTYTGNDGKVYRTICIGTQEWLADNLAETKFSNDDTIPFNECDDLHSFSNIEWEHLETAGCCPYNNDWSNVPMEQPTGLPCEEIPDGLYIGTEERFFICEEDDIEALWIDELN